MPLSVSIPSVRFAAFHGLVMSCTKCLRSDRSTGGFCGGPSDGIRGPFSGERLPAAPAARVALGRTVRPRVAQTVHQRRARRQAAVGCGAAGGGGGGGRARTGRAGTQSAGSHLRRGQRTASAAAAPRPSPRRPAAARHLRGGRPAVDALFLPLGAQSGRGPRRPAGGGGLPATPADAAAHPAGAGRVGARRRGRAPLGAGLCARLGAAAAAARRVPPVRGVPGAHATALSQPGPGERPAEEQYCHRRGRQPGGAPRPTVRSVAPTRG